MNRIERRQSDIIIACTTISLALGVIMNIKHRKKRRWGVRPIYQNREAQGDYTNLINEMRLLDTDMFFNYTRMSTTSYEFLLSLVGPYLQRSSKKSLNPDMRLLITLRYLSTGDNMQSLAFGHRGGRPTICMIIHETTSILWKVLQPLYLPQPTEVAFKRYADEFDHYWRLPHCIGAIDGKHITIQAPNNSGSLYYNYKSCFSLILLGVCDAQYNFTMIDIGAYGSQSDGGVFSNSNFGKALENGSIRVPKPSTIKDDPSRKLFPYFLVGDEAFPLKPYLMRPYAKDKLTFETSVYNYRHSRARRIIENAFGILASRWRLFRQPIIAQPRIVANYVKACVCLHNFIRREEQSQTKRYCPPQYVDSERPDHTIQPGERHKDASETCIFVDPGSLGSNNSTKYAFRMRDNLEEYVNSEAGTLGADWQFEYVRNGGTW